jgi:hypothetical protein
MRSVDAVKEASHRKGQQSSEDKAQLLIRAKMLYRFNHAPQNPTVIQPTWSFL